MAEGPLSAIVYGTLIVLVLVVLSCPSAPMWTRIDTRWRAGERCGSWGSRPLGRHPGRGCCSKLRTRGDPITEEEVYSQLRDVVCHQQGVKPEAVIPSI